MSVSRRFAGPLCVVSRVSECDAVVGPGSTSCGVGLVEQFGGEAPSTGAPGAPSHVRTPRTNV
jgi:hypothetical protein